MGIFEQLKKDRLHVELVEFKNAKDITEGSLSLDDDNPESEDIEIAREEFFEILMNALKDDLEFIFKNINRSGGIG